MEDEGVTAEALRWAVSRLATRLRAEQPGTRALTRLGASVLANLRHGGPTTITGLAEIEGLQPQSLTRTLTALESGGRIRREPDESDGRAQRISLTDIGREALDDHVGDGNRWLAHALHDALTPAEQRVLGVAADLITKVADHGTATPGRATRPATRPSGLPAAPPL